MIRWKKLTEEEYQSEDQRFRIVREASPVIKGEQWTLKDEKDSSTVNYTFKTILDCKLKAETIHKISKRR